MSAKNRQFVYWKHFNLETKTDLPESINLLKIDNIYQKSIIFKFEINIGILRQNKLVKIKKIAKNQWYCNKNKWFLDWKWIVEYSRQKSISQKNGYIY